MVAFEGVISLVRFHLFYDLSCREISKKSGEREFGFVISKKKFRRNRKN